MASPTLLPETEPEEAEDEAKRRRDPELRTIELAVRLIEGLDDPAARGRAIRYLRDRYETTVTC